MLSNYGSSPRTNPSVIYELLFGSQQAVNKAATVEAFNKKLVEDFRRQIESNLPVFYLIDCEEIVNGVLEDALDPQLNANRKRGLSKYLSQFRSGDLDFVELYGDPFLSFEQDYYSELSEKKIAQIGFEAAYIKAYNYLVSKKSAIIKDVYNAINSNLKNSVSIAQVSTDLTDILTYIQGTVADLIDTGLSPVAVEKATKIVSASAAGRNMREAFKKYPKTQIKDPEVLINGFNKSTMILAVAANYDLATTDNHNAATNVFKKYLKSIPVSLKVQNDTGETTVKFTVEVVPTEEFKVGNLVAAGHAAVKSSNKGIIGINTPLLQLALAILQANNKPIPGIVKAFVDQAGHEPYALEINTNYENFAGNLISLQVSLLRSQRSAINSGVISPAETNFFDNVFKQALGKGFLEVRKDFTNRIKSGKVGKFLVDSFAQSPTLKQTIQNKIVATLLDDKYSSKSKTTQNTRPTKQSINFTSQQTKKVSKVTPKPTKKSAVASRNPPAIRTTNLISLQNLINSSLFEKIKSNMGTGSRKDVLNYRTGRFAESVKVEKISESRQGMITAFYTYMKNPYATFSKGGRQESPFTRDPKTLISKSIRELAAPMVANRMRAVLV